MTVLPPPAPAIESVFPTRGVMGQAQALSVTLNHFDTSLTVSSFMVTARLLHPVTGAPVMVPSRVNGIVVNTSNIVLPISSLSALHPPSCTRRQCSRMQLAFSIAREQQPAFLLDEGMQTLVNVTAGLTSLLFNFTITGDKEPAFVSSEPAQVSVDKVPSTTIRLILRNVGDFCNARYIFDCCDLTLPIASKM